MCRILYPLGNIAEGNYRDGNVKGLRRIITDEYILYQLWREGMIESQLKFNYELEEIERTDFYGHFKQLTAESIRLPEQDPEDSEKIDSDADLVKTRMLFWALVVFSSGTS